MVMQVKGLIYATSDFFLVASPCLPDYVYLFLAVDPRLASLCRTKIWKFLGACVACEEVNLVSLHLVWF